MCVILVADEKRPSPLMVDKAWDTNDHGGGLAWREENTVKWAKGLKLEEMQDMIKTLPMPFIAHFRITSTGAQVPELCHPFAVDAQARNSLTGSTKGDVLFHNGTWRDWREHTFKLAVLAGKRLPKGDWNDTRAMAWTAHVLGEGILEMINEKVVLFGPESIDLFGVGWKQVEGIWCSNDIFWNRTVVHHHGGTRHHSYQNPTILGPAAGNPQATLPTSVGMTAASGEISNTPITTVIRNSEQTGGSALDVPFRGSIVVVSRGKDIPKAVQQEASTTGKTAAEEQLETVFQEAVKEVETTALVAVTPVKSSLTDDTLDASRRWASDKNPKGFRSHTPITEHLERRRAAARNNIEYIGRM